MSLIRFDHLSLRFGDQMILAGADFSIEPSERVCLIGRNGAGKSTTFKLITAEIECDSGEIVATSGLVVSQLTQSLPEAMDLSVRAVVSSGLEDNLALLEQFAEKTGVKVSPAYKGFLDKLRDLFD